MFKGEKSYVMLLTQESNGDKGLRDYCDVYVVFTAELAAPRLSDYIRGATPSIDRLVITNTTNYDAFVTGTLLSDLIENSNKINDAIVQKIFI